MKEQTIAICAILKNEHKYLEEWIQHHNDIGITHIHLYEDRGSFTHENIVKKYNNVSLHKLSDAKYDFLYINNDKRQVSLYNLFILEYHKLYDFALFIDLDEFLFFAEDYNLQRLLKETKNKKYQLLWWKIFNANKHVGPQKLVKEAYKTEVTEIYEWGNNCPKVLLNLKNPLPLSNPHETIQLNKEKTEWKTNYEKAWLNHYYTKSWMEWCERFIDRGDIIPDNRQIYEFFRSNPDLRAIEGKLMDLFFNLKEESLSLRGKEKKKMKFVHYFSAIPSLKKWYDVNPKDSLIYDILCYSISFYFLKKTGKEVILYTDVDSYQYLKHLDYDRVVYVPNEYVPKNGVSDSILVFAMEQEDINTCFVKGNFFMGNDYLLRFIEMDFKTDIFINGLEKPKRNHFWDDLANVNDNVLTFLSPELLSDCENDAEYSFLSFNNEALKKEIISEFKTKVKKYNKSKFKEWWKLCKFVNPNVKLLGNTIAKEIIDKRVYIINGIKCNWNEKKQVEEKLDFFKSKEISSLRYDKTAKNTLENLLKNLNVELFEKTKRAYSNE